MSFIIEYNRIVYKDSNGQMLLLIKEGANNVYDPNTNLRARNWDLVASGSEKDIWRYIGKRSGLTQGGILQRARGWNNSSWITIEEYIKLYRSKIAHSKNMCELLKDFDIYSVIEKVEHLFDPTLENHLISLINTLGYSAIGTNYYNECKKVYETQIKNLNDLFFILGKFPVKSNTNEISIHFRVKNKRTRL